MLFDIAIARLNPFKGCSLHTSLIQTKGCLHWNPRRGHWWPCYYLARLNSKWRKTIESCVIVPFVCNATSCCAIPKSDSLAIKISKGKARDQTRSRIQIVSSINVERDPLRYNMNQVASGGVRWGVSTVFFLLSMQGGKLTQEQHLRLKKDGRPCPDVKVKSRCV